MIDSPGNDDDLALDCAGLHARLLSVLNEEATPATVRAVEAHAAWCDECGRLWKIAHESSCRELADFLDDYVDGTLPADQRAVFDRHMSVCPECVAYLESYRQTVAAARDSAAGGLPSIPERLRAAILDSQRDDNRA